MQLHLGQWNPSIGNVDFHPTASYEMHLYWNRPYKKIKVGCIQDRKDMVQASHSRWRDVLENC